MGNISFLYKVEIDAEQGIPSVDKLIESADLHRSVLKKVEEFLPETKSFIGFKEMGPAFARRSHIKIVLERDIGLEQVFSDYTSLAGPPEFVFAGSDYETVNKVLKNHGKRLAKILECGLGSIGRKVVDL